MPRTDDTPFSPQRLQELAARAHRTGIAVFSPFLTPPEAQIACAAARKERVESGLSGGYEDAERQMAGFFPFGEEAFPIVALEISWPHQAEPTHRELLGSLMALGIQRHALGDIVLSEGKAYLFAQAAIARYVAEQWSQAGRARLQIRIVEEWPALSGAAGRMQRGTVSSLRLDAVMASGLNLSRTAAAELIESGHVKLRYAPILRCDARVESGDMISVRGMGRLQLAEVGAPTRKGRLAITLMRFGGPKHRE